MRVGFIRPNINEFVKKYGDGHQKRILRRIAPEKPESYREYGAGFFEGEAAKSRPFLPVQLFFTNSMHCRGHTVKIFDFSIRDVTGNQLCDRCVVGEILYNRTSPESPPKIPRHISYLTPGVFRPAQQTAACRHISLQSAGHWISAALVAAAVVGLLYPPVVAANPPDDTRNRAAPGPDLGPNPPALWIGPPESAAAQPVAEMLARELVIRHSVNPAIIPSSWLIDPMDPLLNKTVREKLSLAEQTYFEMEPQQAGALYTEAFGILRRDPRCIELPSSEMELGPELVVDHAGLAYRIFMELGTTVAAQSLLQWAILTFPDIKLSSERHPPNVVSRFQEAATLAQQSTGTLIWKTASGGDKCRLWLNGRERASTSPVVVAAGEYLASVSCDQYVGWYRAIEVVSGKETTLVTMPEVEQALRRGPYGLSLTNAWMGDPTATQRVNLETVGLLAETLNTTLLVFDSWNPEFTASTRVLWVRPKVAPCVFAIHSIANNGDGPGVHFPASCVPVTSLDVGGGDLASASATEYAGWSLFGIGLAGVAAGAVVHILHTQHVSGEDPPTRNDTVNQEERLRDSAVGLYIGGAAMAATGLTLVIIDAVLSNEPTTDQVDRSRTSSIGVSADRIWFQLHF